MHKANMEPYSDKDIEEAVFMMLENILVKPRSTFRVTDKLVRDLKIDSDDLSFIFVPELENKLELEVPEEEWSEVYTVQDAINLLKRYRRARLL